MNMVTPTTSASFQPNSENTRMLRDAFGRFATGVTVVTAPSSDGPVGITANSFSSVSLDPALVLWSPAKESNRFKYFTEAQHFAIHVLAADQQDICMGFVKDAFALKDVPHHFNEHNVPLIDGCLARFECSLANVVDAGDHAVVLGQVLQAELRDGVPLTFFGGSFGSFSAF